MIDITKHAVLGKFNDIRPGIYKEYMRDLCTDSLDKHSHNTHKLVSPLNWLAGTEAHDVCVCVLQPVARRYINM